MQRALSTPPRRPARLQPSDVLTKAVVRAARLLGISQQDLAAIIGVSPSTVSRLVTGKALLTPEEKSGELAVLLLRVFRSLDALVGGKEEKARSWLMEHNTHLAGVPLERLRRAEGLARVAEYLDAMRGRS
jgi:plasmid maintenance system antidote protein VapI